MNFYRVEFGGLSDWMIASFGYFGESRSKWTQQPDHWSMFYMAYDGVFSLNNRARPFTDGSLIIVAPGMKAGIWPVGDGASHYGFTFGIKKGRDVIAVPSLTDLGDAKELRRRECMESEEWLSRSLWRSIACAYSLLWSVAQPSTILRSSDLMYDFERLVTERLSEKLSVADLADQLDISQSQLLRSVKAEYNQTA
ncbi:MAG: helix-turn-helix transcriptional regulator [Armatimonadetes bacterium]|nr:helix-turn-helix transcriptional regulator [Armatimonadota bacterium]